MPYFIFLISVSDRICPASSTSHSVINSAKAKLKILKSTLILWEAEFGLLSIRRGHPYVRQSILAHIRAYWLSRLRAAYRDFVL